MGDVDPLEGSRDGDVVRETYRHLRMILVALPFLILVGTILAFAFQLESFQDSISAYYLGPLRDVFVGAMVGTAVCLVAYRGPPLEDYALNLAGFYAVFVAFVPTRLDKTFACLRDPGVDPSNEDCLGLSPAILQQSGPDRLKQLEELIMSLRVTIAAVVFVTVVFLIAEWLTGHWSYRRLKLNPVSKRFYQGSTLLGLAFLVLLLVKAADASFAHIHLAATLLLIASMATAVASHAWPERTGSRLGQPGGRYKWVFWLMTVGGIGVFAFVKFVLKSEYATIIAEWWEISLFVAFWWIETRRTWTR